MAGQPPERSRLRFGVFELDPRTGELRKSGIPLHLPPQPFKVLTLLAARPAELVTREEIKHQIWDGDTFVDFEHGLNFAIKKIRDTLGDDPKTPRYIETLPRRGYRFIAPVEPLAPGPAPAEPGQGPVAAATSSAAAVAPTRRGTPSPALTWIVLGSVALIAAISGGVWFHLFRPGAKIAEPMRIVPFTSYPGHQDDARFSPDGSQIAFAWDGEKGDNWDIYVKQMGTEKPLRLTTGPAEDRFPVWSPDGRYIAFLRHSEREDGIYVVPALGGTERRLHTLSGIDITANWLWAQSFDWSPDGKYLAYVDLGPDRRTPIMFLLAVDNPDDNRPLTASTGQRADGRPRFSTDGRTVAFICFGDPVARDIFLVRTAGGEPKRLTFDNGIMNGLDWTSDGVYIVFSSNRLSGEGRLWKVAVSGGQPEPLPVGQGGAYFPSLSHDGRRLAYTQMEHNSNIWRYEVPRTTGRSPAPTKLIASTGENLDPQFSPDGKRITFVSNRSGSREVWVCDSDGSNPRQLTFFGGPQVGVPLWSPDGREIAFAATPEGHDAMFVVSVEGGPPRRLMKDPWNEAADGWSRDGKWIYFASERTGSWQVWKMPSEGGQAVQVTKHGGSQAFESADGKTLYYEKGWTEGATSLWRAPVEGGAETPVLKQFPLGEWNNWALAAEGVYYYDSSTKAIAFFSFATQRITQIAKEEKPRWGGIAVSPDGHGILCGQWDQDDSHIMLVENFRW